MKNQKNTNNLNNIIAIIAIIVIVLSLASIFINLLKAPELRKKVTGYASGYVNLTVNTQITLNVTNQYVNFSMGAISGGATNATLQTNGNLTATVTNGNWTTGAQALAIANVGNVNISVALSGTKTAATFFASQSGTNQLYLWNVSNKDLNSCGEWDGNVSARNGLAFASVNTSAVTFCNKMDFHTASNEMFIDFKLVVPYDATLTGTPQYDTITITGNSAV